MLIFAGLCLSNSCAIQQKDAHLEAYANIGVPSDSNWDTATIMGIDNKRFSQPEQKLDVTPGQHLILVGVSYMRGMMGAPINTEVALLASFKPNISYRITGGPDFGLLGAWIFDETTSDQIAGAFVWNEQFDKVQVDWKRKHP